MLLRGGAILWMNRTDPAWSRTVASCAAVASGLYFQQLGKSVETQHTANVKVRCWPAEAPVAEPDSWADGRDSRIDFVNLEVDGAQLSPTEWLVNRRVLVQWLHEGLLRAAEHWGWSSEPFLRAMAGVEASGYVLTWQTPLKSSPDRRHRAAGVATIHESGGSTRLEVTDRDGSVVLAVDGGPLKLPEIAEAKIRFQSITWVDSQHVIAVAGALPGSTVPLYDAITGQVPGRP